MATDTMPPMMRVVSSRRIGRNVTLVLACGHTKKFGGNGEQPQRTHCLKCEEQQR